MTPVLVGMLDSPYVRRVAVTMNLYGMAFEHQPWSVFGNADEVRRFNPLGRVPALKISAAEVLVESSAIVDFLDEQQPESERLMPATGAERRRVMKQVAMALGVCDKAVALIYERHKRSAASRDPAWEARLSEQVLLGGQWLEENVAPLATERPDQAQLTSAIARRFIAGYHPDEAAFLALPALADLSAACEALPAFQAAPFTHDTPAAD